MRTQCPLCGSRNTYQHSDNQIYEEHMIAQASFRCGKCKKIFLYSLSTFSTRIQIPPIYNSHL